MSELAERVLLSRSGLTRLVDRMEREGLVRREPCEDDARGLFTVLTDAGYDRLRGASGTHLRGVLEHGTGRLDDTEAHELADLLARIADDHQVPPPRPAEGQTLGTLGASARVRRTSS